jgi:hypothetical protein
MRLLAVISCNIFVQVNATIMVKFYLSVILLGCCLLFSYLAWGQTQKEPQFISIFNGRNLDGWDGDTAYWRVEDSALTGEVKPNNLLQQNSFIIWRGGMPADFELKGQFKISAQGNSGINYRSEEVKNIPYALRGYQADIDGQNWYTGQNYEERKRTTLAYIGQRTTVYTCMEQFSSEALHKLIRNNAWTCVTPTASLGSAANLTANILPHQWHSFHLIVRGNRMLHYINGKLMSDVTDNDTVNSSKQGFIGMQVHVGPAMKVQFKHLLLKMY